MRGSWPILGAGALVFLVGFWSLRANSRFLRAEARVATARELAGANALSPATVLALRAQAMDLDDAAFAQRVATFARLARELGEPLAAVAVSSGADAARELLRRAAGTGADAWPGIRREPAALVGVEFETLRRRFAERRSGRTP